MEPRADLCLMDWRLLGESSPLFLRERQMTEGNRHLYWITFKGSTKTFCEKCFPTFKHWNDLLFSGSRLARGRRRCGGGREASHGDTWQSRSAETRGDALALTPTPQRVQETSPGCDKVISGRRRKLQRTRGYWQMGHMWSLFGSIASYLEVIDVILCV